MFAVRRPCRSRAVLLTTVTSAVTITLLGLPSTAAGEDVPSGADTVVGTLVQAWPEYRDRTEAAEHADERPLSWVEPAEGAAVRVETEDVEQLAAGATVEVALGDEVADAAADEGMEPAREVLAAKVIEAAPGAPPVAEALPASSISNHVTVVMVVPAGGVRDGTTLADVVAAVNGPVAEFWSRESNTAVGVGVAAQHDWPAAPYAASCADPTALWDEAQAKTGFVPGPGKHLLLHLPRNSAGCAYGLAELREGPGSGGRLYITDTATSLIAHELGHNFSLGHSSALQCDGAVDAGSCEIFGYGDYYDVMGASGTEVGSLNAVHAASLGFLQPWTPESAGYRDVDLGGPSEHRLHTYWYRQTNIRALRIPGADGADYWLEYRAPEGPDAWLGAPTRNPGGLESGVLLRRQVVAADPTYFHDASYLLDGSPSAAAQWNSDLKTALPVGTPVRVESGGFVVTLQALTADEATLLVQRVGASTSPSHFPRDWTGEGLADLMTVDPAGKLYVYPGNGVGGAHARRPAGNGWQARDMVVLPGDVDGDGHRDLIARNPGNGDLWFYAGDGAGGALSARILGRGWHVMDGLLAPGDWNGDGHADLLARQRSDGRLYLYPGDGSGGFRPRVHIGSGWQAITALAATDDWDGNGLPDFIARDRYGDLYLYSGDGSGGFTGKRIIGRGWNVLTQLAGVGDWDGDGTSDLVGVRTDGALLLYSADGRGGFRSWRQFGAGWGGFRLAG